ncbi:protein CHROMATIN REMODELING 24 [Citrus sinensis]|uniref:Protein CHROMATIN REMODELING 24 n=1 Tax=Citrus sinensis TaxID=2711 RepID=A0ACB8JI67_CITSI|nr:protein CHROMATIN REMODELING 24 [Citrus sinensis]
MAEKKSKPRSLNDSHYRLLQDLASPTNRSALSSFSEYEEKPSVAKHLASSKLNDNASVKRLQFSDTTRFDSTLDDKKPVKVEAEVRTNDCSVLSRDHDHVESRSVIDEEKPQKVKIEGRRRLCKVSSRDVDNTENRAVVDDEPNFSDITDFDSPLQSKTVSAMVNIESRAVIDDGPKFSDITVFDSPPKAKTVSENDNYKGGNEIRDILNDLSARLEILSIDKRRVPKTVDPEDDFSRLVKNGDTGQGSKGNLPEYASAESSFSLTSDLSDSSSGVTKDNVGGVVESVADEYEESKGDDVADEEQETENVGIGLKRNEPRWVDNNLVSARESFESNLDGEEDGGSLSEVEGDEHLSRVHETKKHHQRQKKNEPKRVHDGERFNGRSFVSGGREEYNGEDDCVIVSGKHVVNRPDRRDGKLNKSAHSGLVNVLDDYSDDSVLKDEGSITLSGPRSTYMLPGKIGNMLFPHQREGLRWLWSLHCQGKGGILGDDMGLGKTMQICGFLAGLFHSRLIKRALVVAPKTLLSHWIKELTAVGLSAKIREYFGTCVKTRQYELQYVLQDKGVLLTTYDIVRNNSKSLRGSSFISDEAGDDDAIWDYMILDEVQNIVRFKEKYELPILRGNDKHALDREKRIGSAVAKELRERIQPYFLRRLKNEVFHEDDVTSSATLSKKNEMIVWLRLTSCQQQLYEAFLNSEIVLSAFDGSPLAALTILKKICDHPLLLTKRAAEDVLDGMDSMLNPEDAALAEKLAMHIADVAEKDDFQEQHDNISCKISFILSLLDKLIPEGHNVLIFSQTRKMLNLIQESIGSKGYKFLRIDGTTKASDRVKIVNDFQEGDVAPIFLLTSQVGGLGLTLTKADRVIVVDPAWNPSTDNQSVDRAYRIGQKKDVVVYRLMTCGTVEEKIYRKQIFKGGLFKTATEHKEQIRYFSQQDLRELLSLPKQGFDVSLTQQQLHEEHGDQHNMDESLEAHIQFLDTLGIAGVSHHSLLFSKTARVQVVQEEEEVTRRKGTAFVGNLSSSYLVARNVDGAEYAFNPRDIKLNKKSSSPITEAKLKESDIKERIKRLSQLISNKVTVERLPDKGAKLQKQIAELNSELNKIKMEKRTEPGVIDLDDVTGKLQRGLFLTQQF